MATYIEYVTAPPLEDILAALAKAHRFTSSDLQSNRKGHIGIDQMKIHLREIFEMPLILLVSGIAVSFLTRVAYAGYVEKTSVFRFVSDLLVSLATFHLGDFRDLYYSTGGERLPILVSLFVIAAPCACLKKLRQLPFNMILDLMTGKVRCAEGTVEPKMEEKKAPGSAGKKGETIPEFFYIVGNKRLKVTPAGAAALGLGMRYKVYYLAGSKVLMSIEPISFA